jgi:hypothetical protein
VDGCIGELEQPEDSMTKVRFVAAAAVLLIASGTIGACDSVVDPPDNAPVTLEAVTPTHVQGAVGTFVEPMVVVRNAAGEPVAGVWINFSLGGGAGSVEPSWVVSDGKGRAATRWNLGTVAVPGPGSPNPQTLWVTARNEGGLVRVAFQAEVLAGPAVTAQWWRIPGDTLLPGDTIEMRLRVLDEYSNPLVEPPVTFTILEGDGSLEPLPPLESGTAVGVAWALGTGGNYIQADIGGAFVLYLTVLARSTDEFAWYDLESIEGCQASDTPRSAVGLHESGMFLLEIDWPGNPYRVRGRSFPTGDSLWFYGHGWMVNGFLASDYLRIDLGACNDWWSPADWIYRRRAAAATGPQLP